MTRRGFAKLYERYRWPLHSTLLALARNPDVADDLVARSYLSAWKHMRSFRGESSFYTWLHAIGMNELRNWCRHNGAVHIGLDAEETRNLASPDRAGERLESEEISSRVQAALQKIPPHYRQALTDRFVTGYSTRQAARRRRIPLGTVLSRVANGKRILRTKLED